MVAPFYTRDDGFSLSEMIVALSLLGVILAATYGGLQVVNTSSAVSERQALFAREVSTPLNAMEEALSQAITLEDIGDYSVTFTTNSDHNATDERHVIVVEAPPSQRVTHQAWLTDNARQNTTRYLDAVWSEHNVNRPNPVFEFYDSDYLPTDDPNEAQSVIVTLMVEYDGRQYSDSREIYMRNQ